MLGTTQLHRHQSVTGPWGRVTVPILKPCQGTRYLPPGWRRYNTARQQSGDVSRRAYQPPAPAGSEPFLVLARVSPVQCCPPQTNLPPTPMTLNHVACFIFLGIFHDHLTVPGSLSATCPHGSGALCAWHGVGAP